MIASPSSSSFHASALLKAAASTWMTGLGFLLLMAGSAGAQTLDFGDFNSFPSASSTVVTGLRIGATTDKENSATTNATATGDDTTGSDDEDGVTLPASVTAGSSGSLTVNVTNSTGTSSFLNVWIDYNRNGVLTDSGEQVATNTAINNGTNNSNRTINFTVPSTASLGNAGVRVRLTHVSSPGPDGADGNGEVEDHLISIVAPQVDMGDWNGSGAAASTTTSIVNTNLRLGALVDAETTVTANSLATADDVTGSDDEDGVTVPAVLMQGGAQTLPISVFNNTGSTTYLHTWIDFNNDGSFNNTLLSGTNGGERLEAARAIGASGSAQTATVSFTTPTNASLGLSRGMRVRLTNSNSTAPTGASGGPGEVEDYAVRICPLMVVCPAIQVMPVATQGTAYSMTISALGGSAPYVFSVTSGALPSGLTLNSSSGLLSGTPSTIQNASFTITATDAVGCVVARPYTISVVGSGGIIQVVGGSSQNNVPITATSFLVNGATQTQTAEVSGSNVAVNTNNPVNLSSLTINDTGVLKTLGVANLNGGTVSNVTIPSNNTSFGVLLAGTATSIATSGLAGFQTSAAQIATNTNLNHYIFDDRGEAEPSETSGGYDIRFNYAFTTEDYVVCQERFGNSHLQLQALDATGNVIAGSRTVQVRGTHDWNTGYASSSYNSGQPYFLTVIRHGIFGTTAPIFGFRLRLNGADCKFFGMSDNPFTDNPTSAGVLGDRVWNDANRNGVQDVGEAGVSDVTVRLLNAVDSSVVSTTTTNGSGLYSFTAVAPGDYRVEFVAPSGWTFTSRDQGSNDGTDSDVDPSTGRTDIFTMLPCDSISNEDAGLVGPDFGDYSLFPSASSVSNSNLRLGALTDAESAATTNGTATGDDTTGTDDEDGVTVPTTLVLGSAGTLTVTVTNNSGSSAFLNAWIDFNRNGVLTDAGEQVAVNTSISNGTSNSGRTINFTVPTTASLGTAGVRVRLTTTSSPGPDGADGTGEVEDYLTTLSCPTITISPTTLSSGTQSFAYSQTVTASGGSGTLTYSVSSGTLPNGLSLNGSTGVISGTPTATGSFTFMIRATDSLTCSGTRAYTVQIHAASALGSLVWADVNNDGIKDPGEGGVRDLTVVLWRDINNDGDFVDAGEKGFATTTTNSAGQYSFTGLLSGNYRVAVPNPPPATPWASRSVDLEDNQQDDDSNGYQHPTGGPATSPTITLSPGETDNTIDFGLVQPACQDERMVLYMTDLNLDIVHKFKATGSTGLEIPGAWGGLPWLRKEDDDATHGLTNPHGVWFNGFDVYIGGLDGGADGTFRYNQQGQRQAKIANMYRLTHTTVGEYIYYPRDTFVSVHNLSNGTELGRVNLNNSIATTWGISIGKDGFLYVADNYQSSTFPNGNAVRGSGSIYRIDPKPSTFTSPATRSYNPIITGRNDMTGLDTDADGNLYVVEVHLFDSPPVTSASRVTKFSPQGTVLATYNEATVGDSQGVEDAWGLRWNPVDDKLYIATRYGDCVARLRADTLAYDGAFIPFVDGAYGKTLSLQIECATLDLGDLPDSGAGIGTLNYETAQENGGPTHFVTTDLKLGALVDGEHAANPNNTATGDDLDTTDDEDGIATMPSFITGQTTTLPITVYNKIGAAATLSSFFDWNADGDFLDSGEKITTAVPNNTTSVINLSVPVPAGAAVGLNLGARFRLSTTASLNATGNAPDGEVEDYLIFTTQPTDFGDFNGFPSASSRVNSTLRLGALTDFESTATPNATATGDDLTGSDDEDGVSLPTTVAQGAAATMTVTVTNTSGASAFLNAWIDFNGNGVLTDAGEQVASNTAITTGTTNSPRTLNFTVPTTAAPGPMEVRVRLTSTSSPGPDGFDGNGEVEDHAFTVTCAPITTGPASLSTATLGLAYSQTLTATGGNAPYTWALTTGTLPSGLTLTTSTGVIAGTPTASNGAGQTLTFTVTDAQGCQGTVSLLLKSCPALSVGPTSLPTATVGSAYSQTMSATGGATPYSFAISSGSLPAGLSLSSAGLLSGTPTSTTAAAFTVRATDVNGCAATRAYSMTPLPNTDFGDFSTFGSASNTVNSNLRLGAAVDAEAAQTANAAATGDDTNGTDDEDGATVPTSITAGASATIPVTLTNTSGTVAYLNAWIDFNNNGVLTDAGEQIATNVSVAHGTSAASQTIAVNVPVAASVGSGRGVRFRLTTAASPGATGTGGAGEVEDYVVTIAAPTLDYGDFDLFPSASSTGNNTLRLGASVDMEGTATVNDTATGDDTTGTDDENGVTVPATISQGNSGSLTVIVTNSTGAAAFLNAWIDFNGNGVLTDAGEQIATNTSIATGTSGASRTINFTTPAVVKVGTVGVRVRLTSVSSPGPDGTDGLGEVEDHVTSIVANTDFGDYSLFSSASSKTNSTLRLGAMVDSEGDSELDLNATGDDLDGTDDEDGATVPANIGQGAAGTLSVNVTNSTGSTAYLNVWIDFNRNGVLTDAGEQVATNTTITTGASNSPRTVSFTAPSTASLGTAGIRIRLTSVSSPGPDGLDGNGEVEDYLTTILVPTTDFGDELDFADASSTANSSLRLGALVDVEGSSTKTANASGDDSTGSDDEDGLSFPSVTAGQPVTLPVTVTNTTGAVAYLNAWIDFNNNGVLTDAGEQIATNVTVANGLSNSAVNLSFNIPTNAVTAATSLGTRFRLTNVASPGPTGFSGTGEVEDHPVVILAPLTDFGDHSGYADVSNTANSNLRLGATVDTEYASTRNATATGDDTAGNDDEDGVTLAALTAGGPLSMSVVVTNTTATQGFLNVWIDYNGNGSFTDAGELVMSNGVVATGTTNSTVTITGTVPATAVTGSSVGVRVRLTSDISPGISGSGGVGEVEDHVVTIAAPTTDFGDFLNFADASSTRNATLRLGALTDTEFVSTRNASAAGDDATGSDDEDSVVLPALVAGAPATIPVVVTNTSGAAAFLNLWIDFNNNGSLTDAGEQVATNVSIANGSNNVTQNLAFTVPATALTGVNLGLRVRLTSTSGAAATGAVGSGEVEDYITNISAPTTDFGDDSDFADASQGANPALRLGASLDTEFVSTRNATATGDDITGSDDEDGVTLPAMTAGQSVVIPVTITNNTGANGFLNAWFDFNNNGVLTDSGEQIASNILIASGVTNAITNLNVTVPPTAVTGVPVGIRFRLSAPSGLGPTGANSLAGEVEDYSLTIAAPTTDFGDFSTFGSASSTRNANLRLGALTDTEFAQTTNATATGDDLTGSDDEDAVTFPELTAGGSATIPVIVTNNTGGAANLNAWIDFNNNGVLTDAGEQIASNVSIANGSSNLTRNLSVSIPSGAVTGVNLGARFRLTSTSTPGPTGLSGTGEVEDYVVSIASPINDFGDFSGLGSTSNAANSSLRLGALVDTEFAATTNATATGDDITGSDDEDGVTLPAMTAGQTLNVPVVVTNTTGSGAFLNAWMDFNNDGDVLDAGEQIITNLAVANGLTGSTLTPSITAPANAVTGVNLGVRFRLTTVSAPGAVSVLGSLGEIEDYVINIAAPTTDLGDFQGFADASSTRNGNLRLGALVDAEFNSVRNTAATGDDTNGSDDEDGVTVPAMTAGAPATIPVLVTNTTGAPAFLNAWIDYNHNGVLTDAGEQIATNISIATGSNNLTQNLSITVPATAVTTTSLGLRFRLTSTSAPGPVGQSGQGEVEDYVVSIATPPLDYGDSSVLTSASSNANAALRLGALVDTEFTPTLNATASGDDNSGVDDEDGVSIAVMTAGAPANIPVTVTNTSGAAAFLNVWIDFNNDGDVLDAAEQLATNVDVADGTTNGTVNLSFTVPATAATGASLVLRARLTSTSSPGVSGLSGSGEVEDYVTTIAVPTTDFGDWSGAADASSLQSSNLRMGPLSDAEYASTRNAGASGDDTTASDDEDAVTLAAGYTLGAASSLSVGTTNLSGANAYLNVWVDWNNNGVFTDSGEQIATNVQVANGSNGTTQTVNFNVPASAIPGARGARFRFTSVQNPGSVGAAGMGEVEDHLLTVNCPVISLSPSSLLNGTVGSASSQTLSASGGTAPYSYAISSGTLPTGLSLSNAGVLSGTPTSSAAATFSVRATDANGCSGIRSYTITPACLTISITPTTAISILQGSAFSQTFSASGGLSPYASWTVSSGTLPAGLSLNASTGVLSGTPTASNGAGTTVTLRVTDAAGCQGTQALAIKVCPVLTLAPTTLTAPVVGSAYSQTITTSGGAAAYSYAISSGTLPSWATLSSAGVLSGTPTSTTSATFIVRATDANGCTGTRAFTLSPVCPTITLAPASLTTGIQGTAYSQTLTATGSGAASTNWAVTSGTLPTGLSLNSTSGVLSGTPTVAGSSTFTVRVTDANGCTGTRAYTLAIINLTLGNLVWNDVDTDGVKDAAEPGVPNVPVELLTPGNDNVLGGNGANADTVIATTTTDASGLYSFSGIAPGRYFVRIQPPSTLPLTSLVVDTADNGQDDDNNGNQTGGPGGYITSPVIQLAFNAEPGTAGTTNAEMTIDFGLIPGNSVLWLIDEDYTLSTALRLWSFDNYRSPSTTAHDYGRLKYRRPSDGAIRDIVDAGDIESMAINRFTGDAYILSSGRISGSPTETQSLWTYNLNDAAENVGNIVLTLIGHIKRPSNGAPLESLAYDPISKRFYMGDPRDDAQNGSTSTDRLCYLDIRNLNSNVMLATNLVIAGDMTGLSNTCRYTDGLEFSVDGRLFCVDGVDDDVYQLNPATGAIIDIADSDIAGGPGGSVDVETMAWDEVSSRMIATDNAGQRFIDVTLGSNGANIGIASFVTGVPGMPSSADLEASAMYDTYPPRPKGGIGNVIFNDANANGRFDAGEGVDGVKVDLYEEGDVIGDAAPTASTTTAGGGVYRFSRLLMGSYFVHLPASNFESGAPLNGMVSVPGTVAGDDQLGENGLDDSAPEVNGIRSATVTLTDNGEPTDATTELGFQNTSDNDDDDNSDLTIDFGFRLSLDFGDLADSTSGTGAGNHQTLLANNGPRHAVVTGLTLGIHVDEEQNATVNSTASGDDGTGTDDEDALTTAPVFFAGTTSTLPVRATNTTAFAASLHVWVDFNNNGSFEDSGEKQPVVAVPVGSNNAVFSVPVTAPLSVPVGSSVGLRLRLSWSSSLTSLGLDQSGEVEDYLTSFNSCPTLTLGPALPPAGQVGSAYSQTLVASGTQVSVGQWTVVSGTLPAGLSLNAASGLISGTPTTANGAGVNVTVRVTDANGCQGTQAIALKICPVISLNPTSLSNGTVGTAYSQTVTASGGATPYTYSISSGSLPSWAVLNASTGVISGTPNTTAAASFTLRATDANGCVATRSYSITPACPAVSMSPTTLPNGTAGSAYSQTLSGTAGIPPYGAWTVTSGALPAGLSLNATTGVISGTPTSTNTATFTLRTTDANGCQGSLSYTVKPTCPSILVVPFALPAATVGVAYSQTLSPSGGTAPYSAFTVTSGSFPAGLTLSSSGVLSGTATAANGAGTSVTLRVTDANGCQGTQTLTFKVCPVLSLSPSSLAVPTVGTAYAQSVSASGGSAAYVYAIASGALPSWATLSASTGAITGTPNSTTPATFTVRATDANGCVGTQAYTLTPVCPAMSITTASLALGTVGSAYSQTLAATGGSTPYTWAVSSGTLPAGLTLSSAGVLSGAPTAGNGSGVSITVRVTDAFGCQTTRALNLKVCPAISLTPNSLPAGVTGSPYSQSISATGGVAPYVYGVSVGALPAGLSLNASTGEIAGTPTANASANVTLSATDANGCVVTRAYTLSMGCPAMSITPSSLPVGLIGSAYSQTLTASGGTGPYTWTISSGTLPAGLTLSTDGSLSGTPTTANGSGVSLTARALDSTGCAVTLTYTLKICPVITLSPASLANATVGTAYSQTVTGGGGVSPYTFSVVSGALPAWATLNATTGALTGTPTSTASASFTLRATDANGCTGTRAYTLTPACPTISLSPASLTRGTVGLAYSQTLVATGGTAPYSAWTVTSGSLPAGLALNSGTGAITGTPTAANATGTSFTVRVTDSLGCQGSQSISLQICPVLSLTPTSLTAATVGTAYSRTIITSGGTAPYTYSLASGALPSWATLNASTGEISGMPSSTTSAAFTLRSTDANGCTGTRAYAITPACPAIAITPTSHTAYLTAGYSQPLTASAGTAPFTWTITSGSLPTGFSLSSTGLLSGSSATASVSTITVRVTDVYGCQATQTVTLTVKGLTLGNRIWQDDNNDGVFDAGELGVAGAVVQLMNPGSDNAIGGSGAAADTQVGALFTTGTTGAYSFTNLAAGSYYVRVVPPAAFTHTSGTPSLIDDNVDHNNDGSQPEGPGTPLFSPIIQLAPGTESITDGDTDADTNLTLDFGLWASMAVGNFVFLDINGDGVRNEGESLGNVYIELYAQGDTPGVSSPAGVGLSGCSCKGRYYIEGLNPGNYFLHVPASQFGAGMPLEGLLPLATVVAGDDDLGQDLLFNNNPASLGATSAVFSLRPGEAPVGSAESGGEGATDDTNDANIDLTRDLGFVASGGSGFALAERVRRSVQNPELLYLTDLATAADGVPTPTGESSPLTYASWLQAHDEAEDDDLYPNLVEYALDTDPTDGRSGAGSFRLETTLAGHADLVFSRPAGGRSDVRYVLETSTDGKTWTASTSPPQMSIAADGRQLVRHAAVDGWALFAGETRGFLRLNIELDANLDGQAEASAASPQVMFSRETFPVGQRSFSMPLVQPELFAGRVQLASDRVHLPEAVTLPAGAELYLEDLRSGQRHELDEAASTSTQLMLADPSAVSNTAAVMALRLHHTLADLLPEDLFTAANSAEEADRVLTFEAAANAFGITHLSPQGWQRDGTGVASSVIASDTALLVHARQQEVTVLYTGQVTRPTALMALPGTRFLGTTHLLPQTPLALGLTSAQGFRASADSSTATRLRLWKADAEVGATGYDSLYLSPTGWWRQDEAAPQDLSREPLLQPFRAFFLVK